MNLTNQYEETDDYYSNEKTNNEQALDFTSQDPLTIMCFEEDSQYLGVTPEELYLLFQED